MNLKSLITNSAYGLVGYIYIISYPARPRRVTVNYNQNAYVKGKSIFDAVRAIDDILEFTEREKIQGLMLATDFKKAFDSVNRNFMLETSSAFNFGPTFMRWIRTFYQNITSSVMTNSFSTDPFKIRRGVRQGDPLSPYLFIICLETLTVIEDMPQDMAPKIFERSVSSASHNFYS